LLHHEVVPYPDDIRERLFAMFPPQRFAADELALLHRDIGEAIGAAVLGVLDRGGLDVASLGALVVQAPTIFHGPPAGGRDGVHMEIGEAAVIAETVGVPVVADLRPSDVAAGGQGAPLSAFVDWVLFCHPERSRAVQNIGGIANVTYVPAGAEMDDVVSFDTGPGNMVVDALVRSLSGGRLAYDDGGAWAARGRIDRGLLEYLMAHPYISRSLPKTTGREDFGQPFADAVLEEARRRQVGAEDLLATATACTAECIALHYRRELMPRRGIDEVVLYGGGAHNHTMVCALEEMLAPIPVRKHEEFGIPGDAREAVTWAVLGDETLAGRPANIPAASGARHRVVLGKVVRAHPEGAQA
jgi:anhydro-N-acetylmuramic acid kinase